MEKYIDFARRYLAGHPGAAGWLTLDGAAQKSVVQLAVEDISVYLGSAPRTDDRNQMAAVCEQALWILTKCSRPDPALASESVDGAGSRSYRAVEYGKSFLAERAAALLEPLLRSHSGLISRG